MVLRDLLRDKHWQTYATFCREYDKAAARTDETYVGTYPSRAQLHRWTSGELRGLPFPRHCEVLEEMFPGVPVAAMFEPSQRGAVAGAAELVEVVEEALEGAAPMPPAWTEPRGAAGSTSLSGLPMQLANGEEADQASTLTRSLQVLGKRMRWPDSEVVQLGLLAGQLVDLELECAIDIDAEGWAAVTYRFVLLNLTDTPVKRLLREQWFENTDGLHIEPNDSSDRRLSIQRLHDIGNLVKFACVFATPIEPGGVGTVSYTTRGGRFVNDHFWQQSTLRHTRHLTLSVRHRGVDMLVGCNAVEDQSDGSQLSAIDDLFCTEEDDGVLVTLTRDYLQPGQSVTIRWVVSRAAA